MTLNQSMIILVVVVIVCLHYVQSHMIIVDHIHPSAPSIRPINNTRHYDHIHPLDFGILISPYTQDAGAWHTPLPTDMIFNEGASIYISMLIFIPGPFTITLISTTENQLENAFVKVLHLNYPGVYGVIVPVSRFINDSVDTVPKFFKEMRISGKGVCVSRIEILINRSTEQDSIQWLDPDPMFDQSIHDNPYNNNLHSSLRLPFSDTHRQLYEIFNDFPFDTMQLSDAVQSKRLILMLQPEMALDINQSTLIQVTRRHLFTDAYHEIISSNPNELKRQLCVEFITDTSSRPLNYDKCVSQSTINRFFRKVFHEIFRSSRGLFVYKEKLNLYTINPKSYPKKQRYFRYVGRMIGLALLNDIPIGYYLTLPIYKQLLDIPINIDDLQTVNQKQYKLLKWVLGTAVEYTDSDPPHEPIQKTNKESHIDQVWRSELIDSIANQIQDLRLGMYELIPKHVVTKMIRTPNEMEILISGQNDIDVTHWREKDTKYTGYKRNTNHQIDWFWECVEDHLDQSQLFVFVKLVMSINCPSVIPANGIIPWGHMFTLALDKSLRVDSMLRFSSFSNTVFLPKYSSFHRMCAQLKRTLRRS